jgi:hypothetical protein
MLEERLKIILNESNFVSSYKSLQEEFEAPAKNAEYVPSQKDVLEILNSKNYKAQYFASEKFYKIADTVNGTLVQLNLAFPGSGHKIECILYVENKNENLKGGGPFTLLVSSLTDNEYQAKRIPFSNKDQLEKILDRILIMYESIKKHV